MDTRAKSQTIHDMLLSAGLEHQETLIQLDEMTSIAAASLQRENKYVRIMNTVVGRNQHKGGDWAHLAHAFEDYQNEVDGCLRILDQQHQRQPTTHCQSRGALAVGHACSHVSSRTPALDTVEEGREDCDTREQVLKDAWEETRARSSEAQRIHEIVLSIPRDARKSAFPVAGSTDRTFTPTSSDSAGEKLCAHSVKRMRRQKIRNMTTMHGVGRKAEQKRMPRAPRS